MTRRIAFVLSLLAVCTFSSKPIAAQQITTADAIQKLTGGTSRVWVHEKTSTTMGSTGERCTSGRLYRFVQQSSALIISECTDGKMAKSNHKWAVTQVSPLDMILTVDGTKTYRLSFRDNGNQPLMRLRADTESKTTPNTDMEFRLGED